MSLLCSISTPMVKMKCMIYNTYKGKPFGDFLSVVTSSADIDNHCREEDRHHDDYHIEAVVYS